MVRGTPRLSRTLAALLALAFAAHAQKLYTYVGDVGPDRVLLAWGTTDGGNTIGRTSRPRGKATVTVGSTEVAVADRNWVEIANLLPDTTYPYKVQIEGRTVGNGSVRTWPVSADRLCFFVLGDMGNGTAGQYRIAAAMDKEFRAREASDCPVRFTLTVGDNVYGNVSLFGASRTGASDRDWGPKFFQPYEPLLAKTPFYLTLGNHDGNETESRADLPAYLDNVFFPGGKPARYYEFSFGGLVDFFALDTTQNTNEVQPSPNYQEGSEQFHWFRDAISKSKAPWKVPFFHHPPFSAGPRHAGSYQELEHFINLFVKAGVRVSFSGHEHNLQITEQSQRTHGIRFFVTGAGGELRTGDIRPNMERNAIAGWAAQLHFLLVDVNRREMTVTPMSYEQLRVVDARGQEFRLPVKITLQ